MFITLYQRDAKHVLVFILYFNSVFLELELTEKKSKINVEITVFIFSQIERNNTFCFSSFSAGSSCRNSILWWFAIFRAIAWLNYHPLLPSYYSTLWFNEKEISNKSFS